MDYKKLIEDYIKKQAEKGLPMVLYSWYFEGTSREDADVFLTILDVIENIDLMTHETEQTFNIEDLHSILEKVFEEYSFVSVGNIIIERLSFIKQ